MTPIQEAVTQWLRCVGPRTFRQIRFHLATTGLLQFRDSAAAWYLLEHPGVIQGRRVRSSEATYTAATGLCNHENCIISRIHEK